MQRDSSPHAGWFAGMVLCAVVFCPAVSAALNLNLNQEEEGLEFLIPDGSAEKGNLDFLEGCWTTHEMRDYDWNKPYDSGTMGLAGICFEKNGNGLFWAQDSGVVCRGPARSNFSGHTLVIQSAEAACPPNSRIKAFSPRMFECSGTEEGTRCQVSVMHPRGRGAIRKSAIRFRQIKRSAVGFPIH